MGILKIFKMIYEERNINILKFLKKYQYANTFSNSMPPLKVSIEDHQFINNIVKNNKNFSVTNDMGGQVECYPILKSQIKNLGSLKKLERKIISLNRKLYGFDYYYVHFHVRVRRKNCEANNKKKIDQNILKNLHLDQYKGLQAIVSLNDWTKNIGTTAIDPLPIKKNIFFHAVRLYNSNQNIESSINLDKQGIISTDLGKDLTKTDLDILKKRIIKNNFKAGNGFIFDGFHYPHMGGVWVNEDRISLHIQSFGLFLGRAYLLKYFMLVISFNFYKIIINMNKFMIKVFRK